MILSMSESDSKVQIFPGNRDVGDLKLETIQVCKRMLPYVGDKWMLVTKPLPTYYSCHQHISSPKSVTNIDVT